MSKCNTEPIYIISNFLISPCNFESTLFIVSSFSWSFSVKKLPIIKRSLNPLFSSSNNSNPKSTKPCNGSIPTVLDSFAPEKQIISLLDKVRSKLLNVEKNGILFGQTVGKMAAGVYEKRSFSVSTTQTKSQLRYLHSKESLEQVLKTYGGFDEIQVRWVRKPRPVHKQQQMGFLRFCAMFKKS